MLKPSLQLRLSQQLTITPQLQQAIRLLQLPIMDLQAEIREALENNVMLEAEERPNGEDAGPEAAEASEPAAETELAEGPAEAETDPGEGPEPTAEASGEALDDEHWGDNVGGAGDTQWPIEGDGRISRDFVDRRGQTLQEHLLWQLELERLPPREMAIGRALIDAINDDGYVTDTLEDTQAVLKPDVEANIEEIEAVLELIQSVAPAGVGARSVGECLLLQLAQLAPDTPGLQVARKLAAEHLDAVAAQQFAVLKRRLGISDDELEIGIALVRSCYPRPGAAIHSGTAEYVVPDVLVRKVDERWVVEVNSAAAPRLRVNQTYAKLLNRSSDHAALRTQLQEARWLIRSLEIRNETLLKVARCIVERQTEFFEHGEESMHPMVLRDVAELVEMHESTISRVTTNKYMRTPRGVLEFRFFFSSHVPSVDGGEHSSTSVRAKIRKLISQEDPTRPMSDSKIAKALSQDGVKVARRTVAKYREALSIPPSNERKRVPVRG